MSERTRVKVTVIKAAGKCSSGHKLGDEYIFDRHTPQGLCLTALGALLPLIRIMGCDGTIGSDPDRILASCPDPDGGLLFELTPIKD